MLERRPHALVDEAFGSDPQHLELQLFLRIEMGEEAALGEAELAFQGCKAEPVEALASRPPGSGVENAVACPGALPHGATIRPVVGKPKPMISRTFRGPPPRPHHAPDPVPL